jgi:hypothetical protein
VKTITLTDEAVDLLLLLLHVNRDSLNRILKQSSEPRFPGWVGHGKERGDVRLAAELELTNKLIVLLEEA